MSLQCTAVDRLFARLGATYGAAWDRSLGSLPIADVKTAWAHELAGFATRLQDVAWALEHLPERCPNAIEFRNLCRQAPRPAEPVIEGPKADPERVRAELAKLGDLRQAKPLESREWARRILARRDNGERLSRTVIAFACEALRLPVPAAGGKA